jgi:hypothetical protein
MSVSDGATTGPLRCLPAATTGDGGRLASGDPGTDDERICAACVERLRHAGTARPRTGTPSTAVAVEPSMQAPMTSRPAWLSRRSCRMSSATDRSRPRTRTLWLYAPRRRARWRALPRQVPPRQYEYHGERKSDQHKRYERDASASRRRSSSRLRCSGCRPSPSAILLRAAAKEAILVSAGQPDHTDETERKYQGQTVVQSLGADSKAQAHAGHSATVARARSRTSRRRTKWDCQAGVACVQARGGRTSVVSEATTLIRKDEAPTSECGRSAFVSFRACVSCPYEEASPDCTASNRRARLAEGRTTNSD